MITLVEGPKVRNTDTDFDDDVDPQALATWERGLRQLQLLYDRALDRAENAHRRLNELLQRQSQYQAELNQVNGQIPGAQAVADGAKARVAVLAARLEEHRTARDAATARLLGMMQTSHPLVLLPVRLETRFVARPSDAGEIDFLIRVYPDDIHIDAHEQALTNEEEGWGKQFWENTTSAGDNIEEQKLAWRQLADRFSVRRAAWIARLLDPKEPQAITHRDDAWTRAPQTEILPDRWVAAGYRNGRPVFTAWGSPIPDRLATGLSPQAATDVVVDNLPPVDKDMRWMIDFDAAIASGMGLRIPLTREQVEGGFDRLLVVGVKAAIDVQESATRLTGLLDAQHYTHDLAFVPQNAATNNTAEASSSYTSGDINGDRDYEIERGGPLVHSGDDSDGTALAATVGIAAQVFAHVRHADQAEQRASRAMNTALWPALDSRLLRQLSARLDAGFVRDHFIEHLRARGPLPSLRVGNQPYGLLTAASLNRWRSLEQNDGDELLVNGLRSLWQLWMLYAKSAPRIASGTDMPTLLRQDANSCSYLLTSATDSSLVVEDPLLLRRSSIPMNDPALQLPPNPNYLSLLRQSSVETIRDESYPGWDARNTPKPHPLLYLLLRQAALLLLNSQPPELAGFQQSLAQLESQPVAALQSLMAETLDLCTYRLDAWVTSLAAKRLKALRRDTPVGLRLGGYGWLEDVRQGPALRQAPPSAGDAGGPLYVSDSNQGFVQAPSLAHAATAAVLRSGYLSHKEDSQGDPLAVDLSSERVHRAQWLLDGVRQGQSVGALLGYRFERELHNNGLDRFIYPFRALAGLKAEDELAKAYDTLNQAEQLAREVAELYGQSAEATARANQARLLKQELEAEQQQYLDEMNAIIALGQLASLAESRAAELGQIISSHTAAKPRSGVQQKPGSANFDVEILDESDLNAWVDRLVQLQQERQQASNEAILARGKFNERIGIREFDQAQINALNNPTNPNSIPAVTAQIAREEATASELDQQALSQEGTRGKAEANLAAARAALGELLNQQWDKALESLAANNVVDGLELQRRWKAGKRRQPPQQPWDATTIPFGNATLGFPDPETEDYKALDARLQALDEMVDAVSDVVLAESVYHLVQGNPLRSGATLDAIATGEMAPPELEVIRTPRTGIGLTHRLLVLCPSSADVAALLVQWNTNADQVRGPAEPLLNAWAAKLLGNPIQIRCRAEYLQSRSGQIVGSTEITLDKLRLSPLDVVFMAEGNEEAQRSELEQRLVYHLLRTRPDSVPAEAEVRLNFARDPAWPISIVSFGELVEVARTVRRLLAGARAIDGRDLSLPEAPVVAAIDSDELEERADRAVNALQNARQTLQALLTPGGTIPGTSFNAEGVRGGLVRLVHFGIQGAVPLSAAGDDPGKQAELLAQAQSVAKEVDRRFDRIAKLEISDQPTPETKRDYQLARIREVFGPDFRVLPHFSALNGGVLNQAFGDSAAIQGDDPLAAVTWFQRASRVRDGVSRLDAALMYSEALGNGVQLTFQVGQLPYKPQDRWVALPTGPDQTIPGGRLSLVAHLPLQARIQFDQLLAGLLIDEWVEVVPSRRETTGLSFHYDQPGACAPQAVLIAVGSDNARTVWDLDMLESILNETLDLAQMRALSMDGRTEGVWFEDQVPAGAGLFGNGETWNWVSADPAPFSGKLAHQSIVAAGMHQHFFQSATDTLLVSPAEILFAYVYLDPVQVPSEVMLQWNDGSWEHRAYWGSNNIPWGVDGTASRRFMGPLPPTGQWVRLEVPAELVGLEDREINGMAFTLWDGRATWDRAGKSCHPFLTFDAETIDLSRAGATSIGG